MRPTTAKCGILLAVLVLTGATSLALAQGNSLAAQTRSLNNEILRLHGQLLAASPSEQALIHSRAFSVSQQRAAALAALIEQDPSEALRLAFPPDVLATLAGAFPQAAGQLESHGAWQGPLYYLVEDDVTMRAGRSIRRITVGQEQLDVHFAGVEPAGLKCNDLLRVRGVRAGLRVAAQDGTILASSTAPACTPSGPQNIVAILVNFPNYTLSSSVTQNHVRGVLQGNAYGTYSSTDWSVDGFWQENSDGKTWVNPSGTTVTGPYLLARNFNTDTAGSTYCDYEGIRAAALAAADPYVNFQNFSRIMIVMPPNGACNWAGLGSLGCWNHSTQDGTVTASIVWQRSDQMATRANGVKLSTHELGHNLTLHHAATRDFGAETLGPLGAAGTLNEYGDNFSTMGSWNFGLYSAQHAAQQLNWLGLNANYLVVENGGTYVIQNYEARPAGVKALKIRRGTGNDAWLWLEYRQKTGLYDSYLGSQVFTGALIHYSDSLTGTRTHLLDYYLPASNNWNDPALPAGSVWTDPYSNVSIKPVNATATSLTVEVVYGAVPCTPAHPTVTLSPSNPSVAAGGTVTYSVSVRNNDSAACSPGAFLLSSTQPAGWGASFGVASLTVSPGATGSTTMTVSVPAGTASATYPVSATATKGAYYGTGTANCTVIAPMTLTLSIAGTTFTAGQTVPITATVLSGSTRVSGASVTFTMIKPGGSKTTKKVTTGTSGTAVWSYRVNKQDPKGLYSVTATATYSGQTASSTAPATFTVN